MEPKFGDIFLVNFDPSIGHEYKKVRPAVVLQMKEISRFSNCITVAPISSKLENCKAQDIFIPKDHKNRLKEDSLIKINHINSFDQRRFIKKIGEINSPISRRSRGYLRKHFGL